MHNRGWTPFGFVVLLSALAAPLLLWAAVRVEFRGVPWYSIILLVGLLIWAETFRVSITRQYHQTPNFAFQLAMMILVGWPFTVFVSMVSSIVVDRYSTKLPLIKCVFNAANGVVSMAACGAVLEWGGVRGLSFDPLYGLGIIVVAAAVYYVVNHLCLFAVLSIVNGRRMLDQIDKGALPMDLFAHGVLTVLGFCIVLVYRASPIGCVLLIVPIWLVQYAYSAFFRLRMMARRTVENLATIVDRRDSYTARHSERVSAISEMICDHMSLSSSLTDSIISAAKVHDLGKVGIPDAILLKPGQLTLGEREIIQKHPDMAATIVKDLDLYHDGIGFIRFHHERYDGSGYPGGLRGDVIPFGARVMAVADAYDAMTSDRPYRKALSREEAIGQIRAGAGTQFDPLIAEAFALAMEEGGEACSWECSELSPSA